MNIEAEILIDAPKVAVWKIISDIANAADTISAIEKIEILEHPEGESLVGLKWRETRTLFGKTATEEMWITEAAENDFYQTRAESHGCLYLSRMSVVDRGGGTLLRMDFDGQAQTFMAKLMSAMMGFLFKGATRKALLQDLDEIKAAAEDDSEPALG